ncbi:o-succinylbenzoate--CoA ligase [Anopheles sinensis]|uniref:O-succinylbenzoate--CoA ligase n=1 Tax=Anopheles sinensis TaxID=74873 RepID=A0A084W0I6_ANOSI|nr:o-succinylbenzoate--CoA ligase [Anopheles sinensis]
MARFHDNEGFDSATRLKTMTVIGQSGPSKLNQISKSTADPKVQYKVEDWFSRNMEAQPATKEVTVPEPPMDEIEACKPGEDSAAKEFDCSGLQATLAEVVEENPIKMPNGDESDTSKAMQRATTSQDEISILKRKLRQLQARQKPVEKPKLPVIIGPADCSLRFMLDSKAKARNKKH